MTYMPGIMLFTPIWGYWMKRHDNMVIIDIRKGFSLFISFEFLFIGATFRH